ncbi:MAG: phenylalanine--tRNA ligase subunit alpha [Eubacterium sp.]|nr:phenylalanine--tRNA ligase subunit alpha [Eubacterium sp.]
MKEKLQKIREEAAKQILASEELTKLNEVGTVFLGKKGELASVLKGIKDLLPEERPAIVQLVNETRSAIEDMLEETKKKLEAAELNFRLKQEALDVTLPAKKNRIGHRHPVTIALEEAARILTGMGYEAVEGTDALRTQDSPVQVRMINRIESRPLPLRILALDRVYCPDQAGDAHSLSLHQIEGIAIDQNISFADLKGTLTVFAKELFYKDTKVKFRPHHFPFAAPGAKVDVTCLWCGGSGCRFCKDTGWIETLSCGMMHPKVLKAGGIDPEQYAGFFFDACPEGIAMQKYKIDDMRLLYENDSRFLSQF